MGNSIINPTLSPYPISREELRALYWDNGSDVYLLRIPTTSELYDD